MNEDLWDISRSQLGLSREDALNNRRWDATYHLGVAGVLALLDIANTLRVIASRVSGSEDAS